MKIAVCIPTPPPPRVLQIKKKIWKHFFINKVFEKMFVAVNKDVYLQGGFRNSLLITNLYLQRIKRILREVSYYFL